MVQYMLEEEVTEFLGRLKSARRSNSDIGHRPSERIHSSRKADALFRDDTCQACGDARHRGEIREQAAATVREQDQQGARSGRNFPYLPRTLAREDV